MTDTTTDGWPLELRLLGTFDVYRQGSPLPALRSRKEQLLLAVLAINHGRDTTREWLAATFWPDTEEAQALFYLRKVLSNLRKALGTEAHRLESPTMRLIRLNLSGAFADVLTFDAAVIAKETSEEKLLEALALYRGPLLPGFQEEWLIPLRESRGQSYLSALETVAGYALARGEAVAATRYLHLAMAVEPYRESAAASLMQALAASGDYAAVQQVYRDLRLRLRSDLNATPSPQTEALFRTLSEQGARSSLSSPPPAVAAAPSRRHLPVPLTDLIGRDADIRAGEGWLNRRRLVTLLGPGGVGKTRLAIAVAEAALPRFSEGVWFVDLAPVAKGSFVAAATVRALGLLPEAGQSAEDCLIAQLHSRCLLMVLDNCEHLIDSCAALAATLLAACPDLRILATSRQALGLTGEQVYPVPSLAVPEPEALVGRAGLLTAEKDPGALLDYAGIQLFVQRAVQVNPSFRLNRGNAAAICQICRRLDGIPLAIELAAARMRLLTAEDISGRLNRRFRLLTDGSRSALPRQQTLRALIDWSYDLLSDAEKTMLRRVSVFAGGWTLEAAEAVCAGDPANPFEDEETLDLVSGLVDKNLAVAETRGETVRFRLLETMREYAGDQLRESGEESDRQSRHLDYFLKLAEEATTHLRGADAQVWLERLERDHENFRQALTGGGERELRLANSLHQFWLARGYIAEGRAHYDALLRQQDGTLSNVLARTILNAGNLAFIHSDFAAARRRYIQAVDMNRQLGEHHNEAGVLINLGSVLQEEGDFAGARAQFERSRVILREFDNKVTICICLTCLGNVCDMMGEREASQTYVQEAIRIYRELGDLVGTANALSNLGANYQRWGELALARSAYEEALALSREIGITYDAALLLIGLGAVSRLEGKLPEAERRLAEALPAISTVGSQKFISMCFDEWAQLEALRDAPDRAARLLGAAEMILDGNVNAHVIERAEARALTDKLRVRLGDHRFDAEFAHGRSLTREEAVEMALEGVRG